MPQFSDDEIQQRAYKIYQDRGGIPGDPNADWQEAIRRAETSSSTEGEYAHWVNATVTLHIADEGNKKSDYVWYASGGLTLITEGSQKKFVASHSNSSGKRFLRAWVNRNTSTDNPFVGGHPGLFIEITPTGKLAIERLVQNLVLFKELVQMD